MKSFCLSSIKPNRNLFFQLLIQTENKQNQQVLQPVCRQSVCSSPAAASHPDKPTDTQPGCFLPCCGPGWSHRRRGRAVSGGFWWEMSQKASVPAAGAEAAGVRALRLVLMEMNCTSLRIALVQSHLEQRRQIIAPSRGINHCCSGSSTPPPLPPPVQPPPPPPPLLHLLQLSTFFNETIILFLYERPGNSPQCCSTCLFSICSLCFLFVLS